MDCRELFKDSEIADMRGILALRAELTPSQPIFRYKRKKELVTITYGELWSDIWKLGAYLDKRFPGKGRVALLSENSYYWIVTYFAAVLTGRVIVPLDRDLDTPSIEKLLLRCPAEVLICSAACSRAADVLSASGTVGEVVSMDVFPDILQGGKAEIPPDRTDPDAVCTILFTSGTTGEPKGVMLTQRNITRDVLSGVQRIWLTGPSVLTLPLHHSLAFTINVLGACVCGSCAFISSGLRHFLSEMKEHSPENLAVVPLYVETMYSGIWKTAREQGREKSLRRLIAVSNFLRRFGIDVRRKLFRPVLDQLGGRLRTVLCGGAYLDQKYIDGLDDLGVQILNGYGITECSPLVTFNPLGSPRAGSVGLPISSCEVRILDGEICVHGENVMAGYFEDEAATAEAMRDGWFHTGDLGYLDGDGFLYYTGRKKNLIILSNGENVSAEELELLLSDIPGIDEVVVMEEDGAITAEIYAQRRDGVEEAVTRLNRTLPPYKRIQKVRFRETEFERTTTRKIKRRV